MPLVLGGVRLEEAHQGVLVQRPRIEPLHDVVRAEELEEGAVHEGVAVGAHEAQDEVAQAQVLDDGAGRRVGLAHAQVVAQVALDQPRERVAVDQVALQAAGPPLQEGRDAPQHLGLLLQADRVAHARESGERTLGVPLVQQQARGLLVQLGPGAGQLLVAVEDGHHGQQQRVARQHGDGTRALDGLLQTLALRLGLGRVIEGHVVPAVDEAGDLCGIEVLEHEVAEVGIAQALGLVTHDA